MRIHEDPQQDKECFSDAGADKLLRARDVRHKVGEERCEAKERENRSETARETRGRTTRGKMPTGRREQPSRAEA